MVTSTDSCPNHIHGLKLFGVTKIIVTLIVGLLLLLINMHNQNVLVLVK